MNKLFGIVGSDLQHSFSPKYFEEKFKKESITNCEYHLFPLTEINCIPAFLEKHPNLQGFNVTMPYKKSIIPFLDEIDSAAQVIGAINVVKIVKTGNGDKYVGYNTDAHGFEASLKPLIKSHHTKALILGTGGASKAVAYALKNLGIEYHFISRNGNGVNAYSYDNLSKEIIESSFLIINTTPVGMFPHENETPLSIPYKFLTKNHLLYDLIYNPEKTHFLKEGEKQGASIKNGLEMLHLQAEKAWTIWTND